MQLCAWSMEAQRRTVVGRPLDVSFMSLCAGSGVRQGVAGSRVRSSTLLGLRVKASLT